MGVPAPMAPMFPMPLVGACYIVVYTQGLKQLDIHVKIVLRVDEMSGQLFHS